MSSMIKRFGDVLFEPGCGDSSQRGGAHGERRKDVFGLRRRSSPAWGLFVSNSTHQIENESIQDNEPGLDGLLSDGLGQMSFPDPGRPDQKKHVPALTRVDFVLPREASGSVKRE